jgi:hypothetical protein
MSNDQKDYFLAVHEAAEMVLGAEDPEEATREAAQQEVEKYYQVRRAIRWTDHEEAILEEDVDLSWTEGDSVFDALTPIAFFAFRADVADRVAYLDTRIQRSRGSAGN